MMNATIRGAAVAAALLATSALQAPKAFAWGHSGHVGISTLAVELLPDSLPAFLRTLSSAQFIGELGAEADVSKTTGTLTGSTGTATTRTVHDAERDQGHFLDVDDNGFVVGGAVPLNNLPATREAFDTAQRAATNPGGQDQYSSGYLPYRMIDDFQQIRKDFGIWRALTAALATATDPADVTYFRYQLQIRQQLILRDIGYWSHFVGDGSQPMHVSIHFNGWGNYPNPNGFTTFGIHAPFEGTFVKNFIDFTQLNIRPYTDRGVTTYEQRVPLYIAETLSRLVPVYQADKDTGGDHYANNLAPEHAVVQASIEAGVAELRDEIIDAWTQSSNITVGFPLIRVDDIVSGRVRINRNTLAQD